MNNDWLQEMGVLQLMQMLQELHRRGSQKLRWFSCIATNGCALRCHITTQDNIRCNREIYSVNADCCLGISISRPDSGNDGRRYADCFERDMPRLLEKGRGKDREYVYWFNQIVYEALKGKLPSFYGEWWVASLGRIKVGDNIIPGPPMTMRIISWNIDGINAKFEALKKLVADHDPDVICLQKVKDINCSKEFSLYGYIRKDSPGRYAGVATFIKEYLVSEDKTTGLNHTIDGHLTGTEFRYPHFTLYNVYTPYSNPQIEGSTTHRQDFDRSLAALIANTADRIIICGDMNIVVDERDCWDGRFERNQANFRKCERLAFNLICKAGSLVDTYRTLHPFEQGYSYFFRNDPEVRKDNHGYRIDYFLASESFVPQIRRAEIIDDVTVSTNNPILLEFSY